MSEIFTLNRLTSGSILKTTANFEILQDRLSSKAETTTYENVHQYEAINPERTEGESWMKLLPLL